MIGVKLYDKKSKKRLSNEYLLYLCSLILKIIEA